MTAIRLFLVSVALACIAVSGIAVPIRSAHAEPYACPVPPTGDAWFQPLASSSMPAAYDSLRNAWIIVLGNRPFRLSLDPCGTWAQIPLRTPFPAVSPRWAVFDPVHMRLIAVLSTPTFAERGVWELALDDSAAWRRLPTTGPLPVLASNFANAVFDPDSQRVVIGGTSDTTWVITVRDTATIALVLPSVRPPARTSTALVWDPVRHRALRHGGFASGTGTSSETWVLTLDPAPQWTLLATTGPAPATYAHFGVYDAAHDRIFFQGGQNLLAPAPRAWSLSLADPPVWSVLPTRGPHPATQPSTTTYPVTDRRTDRWLMLATNSVTTAPKLSAMAITVGDTAVWSLLGAPDAPSWRKLPLLASPEFEIHDTRRDRLVATTPTAFSLRTLDLEGGTSWQPLSPPGGTGNFVPTAAVYDPVRDRALFRAFESGGFWELPFAAGSSWSERPVVGTGPTDSYAADWLYDPVHDRVIVLDEYSGSAPPAIVTLSLGDTLRWGSPQSLAAIPPRDDMAAALDTRRNRLLLFGGVVQPATRFRQVWSVDLDTWACQELAIADTSQMTARSGASVTYDPARDRLIVVGGTDALGVSTPSVLGILELAGTPRWMRPATREADFDPNLPTEPRWPSARNRAFTFFDSRRDRLVLHGGFRHGGDFLEYRDDGWTLEWGDTRSPELACPPPAGQAPGAARLTWAVTNSMPFAADLVWKATASREWPGWPTSGSLTVPPLASDSIVVTFTVPDTAAAGAFEATLVAALAGAPMLADTCMSAASVVVDAPAPTPLAFALRVAGSHPLRGPLAVELIVPSAGEIVVEVFDVAGRRVASTHTIASAGGPRRLEPATNALAPGLYAVRARWAGQERVIRAVVLR